MNPFAPTFGPWVGVPKELQDVCARLIAEAPAMADALLDAATVLAGGEMLPETERRRVIARCLDILARIEGNE